MRWVAPLILASTQISRGHGAGLDRKTTADQSCCILSYITLIRNYFTPHCPGLRGSQRERDTLQALFESP